MIAFSKEDFFAEPFLSKESEVIFSKVFDEKSFLVGLFQDPKQVKNAQNAMNNLSLDNLFKMEHFVGEFLRIVGKDVPSFSFLFISSASEIIYLVNDMPPILIGNVDGSTTRLQPSSSAINANSFSLSAYPFANAYNIFIGDNQRATNTLEKEHSRIFSKKEVLESFGKNSFSTEDLNFIFINCGIKKYVKFTIHEKIDSKLSAISNFEEKLTDIISDSFSDNVVYNTSTSLVFSELILNAFEHGVLKITPEQKQSLILEDKLDEYIKEKEKQYTQEIDVSISFYDDKILKITIDDHGEGFDYKSYMKKLSNVSDSSFRGRGLIMSLNICTALFYKDRGNRVTFYVRYKEEDTPQDFKVDEEAYLRSLTVLYVEDDEFIRSSMTHMLKRDVKNLFVAEDGQEGVELYKKHNPSIVITDVEMPKLDGLDMTNEIKKDNPEIRVVITTGYSSEEFLMKAIDVGVDKFLIKPISVTKLRQTLRDIAKSVFYQEVATKQATLNIKNMSSELSSIKANSSHLNALQKSSKEKQELIISNDSKEIKGLTYEIFYKIQEPFSGDMYGIHKIDENRSVMFIIDSMGEASNASFTPLISSLFINNSLEISIKQNRYSFEKLVAYYTEYIKSYILDEECISIAITEINTATKEYKKAGFGMFPTIVSNQETQEISTVKSLNPPFSKHLTKDYQINTTTLPDNFSLFCFSDPLINDEQLTLKRIKESVKDGISATDLGTQATHTHSDAKSADLIIIKIVSL